MCPLVHPKLVELEHKSSLVKNLAPWSSSTTGVGNLSFDVLSFKRSVVDAEVPRHVRLLDEQHRRQEWGGAGADDVLPHHGSTREIKLIILKLRVSVGMDNHRRCA